MASETGPQTEHLTFLASVAAQADRFGVFALLRKAEALAPRLPRIGTSKTPAQDIAELVQVPSTSFPGATLASIDVRGSRPRIAGYWLGLTGPMGPLPLHLTEFAAWEARLAKARPFGRFLDLLAGRMLQFFYRAWAESSVTAQADRPEDDRFADYIAALTGAEIAVRSDAAFPARARLHYAGLFASHRSCAGIEDALTDLLGLPVRVAPFQARWRLIASEERSVLGGSYCSLGVDAVAGAQVRTVTDAFRVIVRAESFAEFEDLLPTGRRFAVASEALDAFAPSHLEWDLEIELHETKVPALRLDGKARLGWTAWTAPKRRDTIRADARLSRQSLLLARRRPSPQTTGAA